MYVSSVSCIPINLKLCTVFFVFYNEALNKHRCKLHVLDTPHKQMVAKPGDLVHIMGDFSCFLREEDLLIVLQSALNSVVVQVKPCRLSAIAIGFRVPDFGLDTPSCTGFVHSVRCGTRSNSFSISFNQ